MRSDVEEIAVDEIVATTDARLFVNDTDDVVPGVDQLRELCLIARPAPEVRREDVKQVVPPAAATRQMTVGYPEMSHSTSSAYASTGIASTPPPSRCHCSKVRRTISTFSSHIAYSVSPAASRASAGLR
jgi:hypothetical protein